MIALEVNGNAESEFTAVEALYRSPTYLRAHIREYLYSFDKGVYWLRAPSGVGKTMFVRGLIAKRLGKDKKTLESIDSNIATNTRSVAVHIREGKCSTPSQFVDAVKAAFDTELNLDEAERAETVPNIRYGNPAEAQADFLGWLQVLRDKAASKGDTRLLLAIDGLEAIAPAGSGASGEAYTIIDLLPAVSEVPNNIILVFTSRPADAWPTALFEQASTKFNAGHGFLVRDITLSDDAYEKMLRLYFWDTVRPMFKDRAIAHLTQIVENKGKLSTAKENRLGSDLTFRDALKADWKKLTNKFPRYSMNPLPSGDLKETFDQIDKLWADTMDRSERRFGFVTFVLTRVVDGSLPLEKVAELAKGDGLPESFTALSQ